MSYVEYDGHQLPDVVRIGPVVYEVVVDGVDPANWGETDHGKRQILLSPECVGEKAKEIILHEVIHALIDVYLPLHSNQAYKSKWRKVDFHETVAATFGVAWLGFMRDNPEYVLYIMEGVFYGFNRTGGDTEDSEDESGDSVFHPDLAGDAGYL